MASPKLDLTLDNKENSKFQNMYHDLMKNVKKANLLKSNELECVLLVYHKFVLASEGEEKFMTRRQFGHLFEEVFNIQDTNVIEGILTTIEPRLKKHITPEAFLKLLHIIMHGDLGTQIRFCFSVYDVHGTGYIRKEKIKRYYGNMIFADSDDHGEIVNDFVDTILRKMDFDRDGQISFYDYKKSVEENPCLLQFMGRCLPDGSLLRVIFNMDH